MSMNKSNLSSRVLMEYIKEKLQVIYSRGIDEYIAKEQELQIQIYKNLSQIKHRFKFTYAK